MLALPHPGFALINGKPLVEKPDVVRLIFTNGWVCSGIFIDQYTILTAAHCLVEEKLKTVQLDRVLSQDDRQIIIEAKSLIPHPLYVHSWWPSYDIGVIKTSKNINFRGDYKIESKKLNRTGNIILMGAGRNDLSSLKYVRTIGSNTFFRIGSVLFFWGSSRNSTLVSGENVSVAPNDSGGPVIDQATGKIIGVMTTTTLKQSVKYGISALNTGTSIVTKSNLDFLVQHLGPE